MAQFCIKKDMQCEYASTKGHCNKIHCSKTNVDEISEFILRRFPKDCNWTNGNCYYFAIILKDRFPEGKIFYDIINGHFVFKYQDKIYDWNGIYNSKGIFVDWEIFDEYDSLQKQRIIRDCVL